MKINIRQFAQNCHSRFHIREIKEKLSYQNMFIYRNRQNTFRNLNIMRSERAIKNPRPLTAEMGGTLSALWRQRNFNHFTPRLLSNKLLLIFWFPLGNDLCYTSQDLFWAPHRIPPVTCYFLSFIACFVNQIAATASSGHSSVATIPTTVCIADKILTIYSKLINSSRLHFNLL